MHDADRAAVLVDDDREVLLLGLQLDEQVARLHRLGHVGRRVREVGDEPVLALGDLAGRGLQDVEHVDDADDVVDARPVDRHARVLLVGDLERGLARSARPRAAR